jgi:hypothetical protein
MRHNEKRVRAEGLTDSVQLRRIKYDRAVDTSEASASARTEAPLPAANAVRLHAVHCLTSRDTSIAVCAEAQFAYPTRARAGRDERNR